MLTKAKFTYIRMSPRKIRYVLDLVREKPVPVAYSILARTQARACEVVRKLIRSAADSAEKNHKVYSCLVFLR